MNKKMTITILLAICLLSSLPNLAGATSGIRNAWQNYYDPCPTLVTANCAVCHPSTKALTFNAYGSALLTRIGNQGMSNDAAFLDAESVDSDGDGYTNGQEIVVDCTLPGDDGSHGVVADVPSSWGQVKALFR